LDICEPFGGGLSQAFRRNPLLRGARLSFGLNKPAAFDQNAGRHTVAAREVIERIELSLDLLALLRKFRS
jgi:hypothetical protein